MEDISKIFEKLIGMCEKSIGIVVLYNRAPQKRKIIQLGKEDTSYGIRRVL